MKMTMRDLTGGVTRGVSLKLAVLSLCVASVIAGRDSDRMASRLHRQLAGMRRRLPKVEEDATTAEEDQAEVEKAAARRKEAAADVVKQTEDALEERLKREDKGNTLPNIVDVFSLVDEIQDFNFGPEPETTEKVLQDKIIKENGEANDILSSDFKKMQNIVNTIKGYIPNEEDAAEDEQQAAGAGGQPWEQEEKKGDWKGLAGATSGLCGVSLLTYSMSTWINGGCKVADPTAFWIPFGIGAGLLLIGLATCLWKKDLINKQRMDIMGIAAVLVFQASAISMIAFGGFEQAGKNVIHINELGGMNVFLLIGASVFVVSLIFMGIFYKCGNPKSMNSQLAMGLGAVLTVLVGGSATTIALSPTLLTGSEMWIGIGVGAFVLLAMLVQASISCVKFGGDTNSMKTGAIVFAAWTTIIAALGTSGAMISTSAINGFALDNPFLWTGVGLAVIVLIGVISAASCAFCGEKKQNCRYLFFK